jgi:4-amino-4-deoxy-L-arabinose transferase-like glycosyltransferase
VLSYKVFGLNEFALRLPSALAIVGAFYFIFRIVRSYKGNVFAFFTCLMLISINGLIGPHVGRTGDTDALLVFFLAGACWFFLQAVDYEEKYSWLLVGVFLGLAFWTKGPASLVVIPAFFLYLIISKKFLSNLRSRMRWAGAIIFLGSIGLWVLLVSRYGIEFSDRPFAGKNSMETMVLYDIVHRFFGPGEHATGKDYGFFLTTLDSKFWLWNYLAYLLLFVAILRKEFKKVFKPDTSGHLHLFSFLIWSPAMVFFTFASSKHSWYLAPFLPFLGINIWGLIQYYQQKHKALILITILVFLITLGIKTEYLGFPEKYDPFLSQHEQEFRKAENIVFTSTLPLDRLLYIHFRNPDIAIESNPDAIELKPGSLLIVNQEDFKMASEKYGRFRVLDSDEESLMMGGE